MNEEVVDNTLRDLDTFSPEKDCGPTEDDLSLDIYEGLSDKAIAEVPTELDPILEDLESSERRDVEKLGLRKEKQPMQWSFEVDLHLGSKDKEGPSTEKRAREGLPRKVKGKTTFAGTKTSRQVRDIRD